MIEIYIFSSMLRELFRFKRIVWWILIIIAVAGMGWAYIARMAQFGGEDPYVLLSAALVFRVLPLCAAINSMAVISQEASQRTIVYLLTRPVPRWKLLVFRTLAAIFVVFCISAATELAMAVATGNLHNPMLGRDLGAILAGAAAYTSFFTFLSLLIKKAMIYCLLFAFVWETAVPNMPGDLYRLSISGYLTAIAQRPPSQSESGGMDALAGLLGVNIIPASVAWMSMIGLSLVCIAVGGYWFSHFEYTASEDGE